MKTFLLICALAVFSTNQAAHASSAHCGEVKTLNRTATRATADSYSCVDKNLQAPLAADAGADAEAQTRDRFGLFDRQCVALGGAVEESNVTPSIYAHAERWFSGCTGGRDDETNSGVGPNNCTYQNFCQVDVSVAITHSCNCSN